MCALWAVMPLRVQGQGRLISEAGIVEQVALTVASGDGEGACGPCKATTTDGHMLVMHAPLPCVPYGPSSLAYRVWYEVCMGGYRLCMHPSYRVWYEVVPGGERVINERISLCF